MFIGRSIKKRGNYNNLSDSHFQMTGNLEFSTVTFNVNSFPDIISTTATRCLCLTRNVNTGCKGIPHSTYSMRLFFWLGGAGSYAASHRPRSVFVFITAASWLPATVWSWIKRDLTSNPPPLSLHNKQLPGQMEHSHRNTALPANSAYKKSAAPHHLHFLLGRKGKFNYSSRTYLLVHFPPPVVVDNMFSLLTFHQTSGAPTKQSSSFYNIARILLTGFLSSVVWFQLISNHVSSLGCLTRQGTAFTCGATWKTSHYVCMCLPAAQYNRSPVELRCTPQANGPFLFTLFGWQAFPG